MTKYHCDPGVVMCGRDVYIEKGKKVFFVSGYDSLKGYRNVKIFPFFFCPVGKIWNREEGSGFKSTNPPCSKCHIRSKKPCCSREITFRLQGCQWHKLTGNFASKRVVGAASLEGEWQSLAQNTSYQRANWVSSRPARSVNGRSWWAAISSSEAVKKKKQPQHTQEIVPMVQETYTSSQIPAFTV